MNTLFKNKTILITGGTGSFGNLFLQKILNQNFKELRILSRDEEKQDKMRNQINNQKIKFIIGDVKNKKITNYFNNVDYVIHTAALKQVPSCEFFPLDAYETNTLGTSNVIEACIQNNVQRMIMLSTDKAVYPINSMGLSKAMAEKILIATGRNLLLKKKPILNIIRYGNVLCSRGSIVPKIISQLQSNKSITITDVEMTRFVMSLNDAFDLLCNAIKYGKQAEVFIQKARACKVVDLIKAIMILAKKERKITSIGIRHGEKLNEVLISREEMTRAKIYKNFIKISPDVRNLNYDEYFTKGNIKKLTFKNYSSDEMSPLNVEELVTVLKKEQFVKTHLLK